MALDRTYRLTCDGWSLIDLNRNLSAGDRQSITLHCVQQSPNRATSTKARSAAKGLGWVRHREDIPINPLHPSAGTSLHRFDLCPNCAKALIKS